MRPKDSGFSLVDFLIIIALLLIVIGLVGPRLHKSANKMRSSPTSATLVQPVGPSR